ncbi:hypothetical protein Pelo_3596 [Pelomyxa schiedti]|nr:hypothetical protein Pelo_3596 [Pelomyxa schiedti]
MRTVVVLIAACCGAVYALNNGLGLTPQMGWNSWNHFGCDINEDLIKGTIDQLVSTGLAAAGYKYVNLDDCWQTERTADGTIVADPGSLSMESYTQDHSYTTDDLAYGNVNVSASSTHPISPPPKVAHNPPPPVANIPPPPSATSTTTTNSGPPPEPPVSVSAQKTDTASCGIPPPSTTPPPLAAVTPVQPPPISVIGPPPVETISPPPTTIIEPPPQVSSINPPSVGPPSQTPGIPPPPVADIRPPPPATSQCAPPTTTIQPPPVATINPPPPVVSNTILPPPVSSAIIGPPPPVSEPVIRPPVVAPPSSPVVQSVPGATPPSIGPPPVPPPSIGPPSSAPAVAPPPQSTPLGPPPPVAPRTVSPPSALPPPGSPPPGSLPPPGPPPPLGPPANSSTVLSSASSMAPTTSNIPVRRIAPPPSPEQLALIQQKVATFYNPNDPRIQRSQHIIRTWLLRRARAQVNIPARKAAFKKLVFAERELVRLLKLLVLHYIVPIERGDASATITQTDITNLCGEARQLLTLHTKILKCFDDLVSNWPCVDGVGRVFLDSAITSELAVYGSYVEHSLVHSETLKRLQTTDHIFAGWVQETFLNMGEDKDFGELLACPLNHMNVYASIMRELISNTPVSSPDFSTLTEAEAYLQQACNVVTAARERSTSKKRYVEAVLKVGGFQPTIFPEDSSRQLVAEFDFSFMKNKKPTPLHGILFSDQLILLSCKKDKKKGDTFKRKFVVKMSEITELANEPGDLTSMSVTINKKTKYIFKMNTNNTRNLVLGALRELYDKLHRKRFVFGCLLDECLQSEERMEIGVPLVVERGLLQLELDLDIVGIFRIPGQTNAVSKLKKMVQDDINFKFKPDDDPFTVGSLVKMYFREMTDPLMPFSMYEKFLELNTITEKSAFFAAAVPLLNSLPPSNKKLLKYVSEFVMRLISHSAANKMDAKNASICLAPNFLRPQVETMESALMMPKVNLVITKFFEWYPELKTTFS